MLFLSSVKRLRKVKDEGNTNKLLNTTLAIFLMRSPGFEPGSSAWEADVLAKLDYDRYYHSNI